VEEVVVVLEVLVCVEAPAGFGWANTGAIPSSSRDSTAMLAIAFSFRLLFFMVTALARLL
jgi:hypothetical protein